MHFRNNGCQVLLTPKGWMQILNVRIPFFVGQTKTFDFVSFCVLANADEHFLFVFSGMLWTMHLSCMFEL